jgi:hypothetical protein
MKSWVNSIVATTVVLVPLASFAQASAPVTRAEVRQELAQLQSAGYTHNTEEATYPTSIQTAEARVGSEFGASTDASARSGGASKRPGPQDLFFGQ